MNGNLTPRIVCASNEVQFRISRVCIVPLLLTILSPFPFHSYFLFPPAQLTHTQAWAYMLGGLIIYAIERTVRFFRSLRKVVIIKVVEHPSKTIEIQMRSKGFFADAGQYVFVNVPSAALFEWHPFTLTSVSFSQTVVCTFQPFVLQLPNTFTESRLNTSYDLCPLVGK